MLQESAFRVARGGEPLRRRHVQRVAQPPAAVKAPELGKSTVGGFTAEGGCATRCEPLRGRARATGRYASLGTVGLWLGAVALAALLCMPVARAQISCAPEPPQPPKRISGGEGFPPLPLPATPLRRTERKRAPAPPTLMAKVNYGEQKVMVAGKEVWQWTSAPGDMQNLFKDARAALGINYKADIVRLDKFEYSPESVPVMYFSGREAFVLGQAQRDALRTYVLRGGAILAAAGNGTDAFSDSFVQEMRTIFPDRPWYVLPPDHPLYQAHYALKEIQYRRGADDLKTVAPQLEGLNIGCRAAIVLSRADLSCGWDNHTHPDGYRVMPDDAKKLGINLLAYALANYRLGRVESVPVVFRAAEETADAVEVGQIVHSGDWDPCPSSLQYMLRKVSEGTTAGVNYRRVGVELEKGDLMRFPFLYLTGHLDFHFSKKEEENLRQYLQNGGFLLVSNCCNRTEFDRAVRRELKAVLPEADLEALGASHAIYSSHYNLLDKASGMTRLEGITRGGTTCVVYSPASMATAWDDEPRPFIKLPDTEVARELGVNALVYAMTH